MSATVRFSQLVTASGKPQLHTLWGPPEKDPEFQRAIKAGRVLTIHQENVGSKKDYGVVGFSKDGPAQYLVFPRSLKRFEGQRVVGIKYEVFDVPLVSGKAGGEKKPSTGSKSARSPQKRSQRTVRTEAVSADGAKSKEPPKLLSTPVTEAPDVSAPRQDNRARISKSEARAAEPVQAHTRVDGDHSIDRARVVKELRTTMKELEAGKAVIAFRRLEKLVEKLASAE